MIFQIENLEAKNQLFCDSKAITSLRLNIFQQSLLETSGVVLKIELKRKTVDLFEKKLSSNERV